MTERSRPPRLVVITDWSLGRGRLLSQLERALGAGPQVAVQHRHPEASTREFFEEAQALARLTERAGCPLFINGRLDVALAVGAHLHLPSRALRPADIRPLLPPGRWLSVAVHDASEAASAAAADFALVSPVFSPVSKSDERPPLGATGFAALADALQCPAYALGGVTPERLRQGMPAVAGCASIGAVLGAEDPQRVAAALVDASAPARSL